MNYEDLSEQAGFGGVLRRTMAVRIRKLVDLARQIEREHCALLCEEKGDYFRSLTPNDFHEGKMDGAYCCADLIRTQK